MQSQQERYYDTENSLYKIPVEYKENGVYPGKDSITCDLVINIIRLASISVSSPLKTSYRYGEAITYEGAKVTAVYSDGSTEDVTSSATFSPASGTVVSKDMNSTINVSVSYSNIWTGSAATTFSFSIVTLQQELQISPPDKTAFHKGEALDFTGITVTAVYSDESTQDVTSSAVFSPEEGTIVNEDMPVSVSYSNRWNENASGSFSFRVITLQRLRGGCHYCCVF